MILDNLKNFKKFDPNKQSDYVYNTPQHSLYMIARCMEWEIENKQSLEKLEEKIKELELEKIKTQLK